jgi:hypothetical protein
MKSTQVLLERAADFGQFKEFRLKGQIPFLPLDLVHIYIKLDFKPQFENAGTAQDARGFLRSIARATMTSHRIAERYMGTLLEVQGSTIHMGLPDSGDDQLLFLGDLHTALQVVFSDPYSRVEGWRMTVDVGRTLIVAGRGVHGDESYVSLGKSANRPAKHLYEQLELPEEKRDLKRFYVGLRDPDAETWKHEHLEAMPRSLNETQTIANETRMAEPTLHFFEAVGSQRFVTAQAAPIGPAGTPASPSANKPHTYFGWVMRTDLDGFTARVDECFDDDEKLRELAQEFNNIMDAAANFVELHNERLAQLPWAGDNFTAAAVFASKEEYDLAVPTRLVELSLDFEKEMVAAAVTSGFGGWAHGVAGGTVHGNSNGNVYIAGVEVGQRRFLVGAGEGFGRSTQAFGNINPKPSEMVLYKADWEQLDAAYKDSFEIAKTHRGEISSLYRITRLDDLRAVRSRAAAKAVTTTVTFPNESREIKSRPYHR